MKCPNCDGKGTVLKIIYEDWQKDEIVRSAVKCPRCNGSGEVSEVEMTNEEWFCSLSTEDKADKLTDFSFWLVPTIPTVDKREQVRKRIENWLKEKHDEM